MERILGANSSSGRRADRSGSAIRRRPSQRVVEIRFDPKIEWVDTTEAHVLVLEVPGFKKEDVKVEFDGGENITISGERFIEDQGYVGGISQPRQKISSRFKRVFPIPTDVEITGIATRFEHETMYITFNKLKAPPEVKPTNDIDQERKSIPQDTESSAKLIEESSEKKDDKTSDNKLDQSVKDGNVGIPNVPKSSEIKDEKELSNKIDQTPKDEKVETSGVVMSSASEDEKASSSKLDQSPSNDKVETLGGEKSTTTQDEKTSNNKQDQSIRDEKVETLGGVESTTTQDEQSSSNKIDQSPRNEKIQSLGDVKSAIAQAEKVISNKQDQSIRDQKVETPGDVKSTITQDEQSSRNKIDQSPRNEKIQSPGDVKSTKAQDEKVLSNKPDQSPRDEMVQTIHIVGSIVAQDENVSNNNAIQSPADEKVRVPEATKLISNQLDDEKVAASKVISSSKNQEEIQAERQVKSPNELEELAKHPSSENLEKLAHADTLQNQPKSSDSKQEVEMKFGDQYENAWDKNPIAESTFHGNIKQDEKVSILKAKMEGYSSIFSKMKEDAWEKEKQYILKACTYVSQFISPRRESMIAVSVVAFSLGLYITYKVAYSKD